MPLNKIALTRYNRKREIHQLIKNGDYEHRHLRRGTQNSLRETNYQDITEDVWLFGYVL